MKLEQQTDGTWLATQIINNKLRLSEGRTGDEAWNGIIEMMDEIYKARIERFRNGEAA